jgi:hypothetical protein
MSVSEREECITFSFCPDMLLLAIRDPMGGKKTQSGMSQQRSENFGAEVRLDEVRKNRYH